MLARLRGNRKELKQAEEEKTADVKEPKSGNAPAPKEELKLDTAPVKNFKKRVAQELYEPWMDGHELNGTPVPKDSPALFPQLKQRSKYAFAKDYVHNVSKSPSLAEEVIVNDGGLGPEEGKTRKEKAIPSPVPSVADSTKTDQKTPLPTLDELRNLPRAKSKIAKKPPIALRPATILQPTRMQTRGAGSSLLFPRATSALIDLDQREKEAEKKEFVAWVLNGREDDISSDKIESILFRNRRALQ